MKRNSVIKQLIDITSSFGNSFSVKIVNKTKIVNKILFAIRLDREHYLYWILVKGQFSREWYATPENLNSIFECEIYDKIIEVKFYVGALVSHYLESDDVDKIVSIMFDKDVKYKTSNSMQLENRAFSKYEKRV